MKPRPPSDSGSNPEGLKGATDSQLIFSACINPMSFTRADTGSIIDVNPAWLKATGFQLEQVLGKTALSLGLWPDDATRNACLAELKEKGRLVDYELVLILKSITTPHLVSANFVESGSERYVLWEFRSIARQKEAEERISALLAKSEESRQALLSTLEDVRRTQQALQESEERFGLAMRATNDGLWDWNMQTQAVYFSPRWKSMLGYADNELENSFAVWERLVDDAGRANTMALIRDCIMGHAEGFSVEFHMRHKDGHWVDILAHATLIRDANGVAARMVGTHEDLTERKRVKAELHTSRERLRAMVAATPSCIKLLDAEGHLVEINRQGLDLIEANDLDQVKGCCAYLMVVPAHRETYRQFNESICSGVSGSLEYQIQGLRGTLRWVHTSAVPMKDPATGRTLHLAITRDITDQKRSEEELKQSEQNYREIFNSVSDAVFIHDAKTGAILEANDAMLKLYGLTLEEAQRLSPNDTSLGVSPYSAREVAEWMRKTVQEGPQVFEWHARKKNQELFWAEVSLRSAIINGQARILAVVRNITERKQAAEMVRQNEEKLSAILNGVDACIYLKDTDGRYLFANAAVCQLWNAKLTEIIGFGDEKFFDAVTAAHIRETDLRVLAGETVRVEETNTVIETGQTFTYLSVKLPLFRSDGSIYALCGISTEITERRSLEAQLRQAQKLEAIGQLAGGVAHDFNNILAVIMMHLDLLRMNPTLDPEVKHSLNDLNIEAKRAASLTRQLLMFSRRSVLDVKPQLLNELTANVLKMLTRLVEENVKLNFEAAGRLPFVEADGGMLEQVIMNLVVNARDSMPAGGVITLSTSSVEFTPADLALQPERRTGLFVCLTVADTGCGMDAETLKHIFEPFFTTKEAGKGTGLGLATVYGIVAQHKGWVEVESRLNRGSSFRVFLPAMPRVAENAAADPEEAAPVPSGQETILLVEDDKKLRESLEQALSVLGYKVFAAPNGREAMRSWHLIRDQVDLLLTDMVMPEGMTGLELTALLRAIKPGLKVIVSSGYSDEIVQAGVPDSLGVHYLPKPYEIRTLGTLLRKCLDR